MNLEEERAVLKNAFEAFKVGNDSQLRQCVENLICAQGNVYDLAVIFEADMNSPGKKFSPEEKFYGECVSGQLYFMAMNETCDRDLVVKSLGEAQNHFDQAYVISESLPEHHADAMEMLKQRYLSAEKMINGVNMLLRV